MNSDWKEFTTPEGRPYYFNKVTKEVQWQRPQLKKEEGEKLKEDAEGIDRVLENEKKLNEQLRSTLERLRSSMINPQVKAAFAKYSERNENPSPFLTPLDLLTELAQILNAPLSEAGTTAAAQGNTIHFDDVLDWCGY
eukprot:TRINITY_DN1844_c0_g1_i1.p1 TRINITY_DN1844_c0_g1~~TRINITY_DN1844_c0_g1_i1.p1  ORF type:complete len:138 (+),score=26.26 TRINITY_DN1844_c0_g1_i1:47-460(+)